MRYIKYPLCFLLITSCNYEAKEKIFTIEMQKINGEWITGSYMLPEDVTFYIHTYEGSYSLEYKKNNPNWLENRSSMSGTIRNGIIDFKVN